MWHFLCRLNNHKLSVLGGWGSKLRLPLTAEPRASFQPNNNLRSVTRFLSPNTSRLRNIVDPQCHCNLPCSSRSDSKDCRRVERMRGLRFSSFQRRIVHHWWHDGFGPKSGFYFGIRQVCYLKATQLST